MVYGIFFPKVNILISLFCPTFVLNYLYDINVVCATMPLLLQGCSLVVSFRMYCFQRDWKFLEDVICSVLFCVSYVVSSRVRNIHSFIHSSICEDVSQVPRLASDWRCCCYIPRCRKSCVRLAKQPNIVYTLI